jgi:hypothetical protein
MIIIEDDRWQRRSSKNFADARTTPTVGIGTTNPDRTLALEHILWLDAN